MKRSLGGLLTAAGVIALAVFAMPGESPPGFNAQPVWFYEGPTLVSTRSYASDLDELRAEIAREKNSLREAIRSPGGTGLAAQTTVERQAEATVATAFAVAGGGQEDAPASPTIVHEQMDVAPPNDSTPQQLDTVDHDGRAHGADAAKSVQPPSLQLKAETPRDDGATDEVAGESLQRVEEQIGPSVDRSIPAHFDEERGPRALAEPSAANSSNSPFGAHEYEVQSQTDNEPLSQGLNFPGSSSATAAGVGSSAAASGAGPTQPELLDHGTQNHTPVEPNAAPSEADHSATGNLWSTPDKEATPDDSAFDERPQHADWSIAQTASDIVANAGMAADGTPMATTADRGVTVRWQAPEAVNLGQELACQLLVANGGDAPALGVEIYVNLPEGVTLLNCDPRADAADGVFVWRLGKLMPAETRQIQLVLRPEQPGRIQPAVAVKSTSATRAQFDVLEPRLDLVVEGPDQVTTGQAFAYQFHISNSGSGSATGVVLHLRMDSKLQPLSSDPTQFAVGTLAPGQSRRIQLFVSARESGSAELASTVTCDAQSTAEHARRIEIIQPRLQVALDGPSRRFVDRKATYVITVHNPSPAPAENVQIFDRVPDGFRFHKASPGGSYDRALRQVGWFVGRLEPNETTQVGVELIATEAGEHQMAAAVHADAGATDETRAVTRVEGAAAVALEVVDTLDPIELGGETTYEIRLANQGTGPAHQLQIAAELPDGLKVLSAEGPTRHQVEGNRLVFDPLRTLQPGETVVYTVRVQSRAAGSARFRAYFRSAEEPEAVLEEELTRVYGE